MRSQHPTRLAWWVSGIYFCLSLFYIIGSGTVASSQSLSARHLWWLEMLKGPGFLLVTSVLLFFLCRAFSRKLMQSQTQNRLQHAELVEGEKRAMTGLLALSVAHDVRNLLAVNSLAVKLLRLRNDLPGDLTEVIDDLHDATLALEDLVGQLSLVGGERGGADTGFAELGELILEAVDLATRHFRLRGCTLTVTTESASGLIVHRGCLLYTSDAADET